jgi:tight adherence protein B
VVIDMPLVAVCCGAGVGLGLLLLAGGLRRRSRPRAASGTAVGRLAGGRGPVHLAAVLVVAAVVALATGWLVGGMLAGLAVWALPGILKGAEQARTARLQRLEAVAAWTESLRDTLSAAAGLEQTITATAATAPAALRPHVSALAQALNRGVRLPQALRAFAADLADPVADTVVAALLLASAQGGGNLGEPLSLLAAATRENVAAQRRVERSRAKAATDARMIIATTLAMAVGLTAFDQGFLDPYDSAAGQIVLAVVGLLFAIGFRWLHALSRQTEPDRILALSADTPSTDSPVTNSAVPR